MSGEKRTKRVILESPYAGDVEKNLVYARRAMADCLKRGEAPFASHLLYTQEGVLDDNVPAERDLGISAGLQWGLVADATAVYVDLGVSSGMLFGIEHALQNNRPVEFRALDHPRECAACVLDFHDYCEVCADEAGEMVPEKRERFYKEVGRNHDALLTGRAALLDIKLHHKTLTSEEEERLQKIRLSLDWVETQRRLIALASL